MNTKQTIEISIVMPCLNEAETVAKCINKAHVFFEQYNIQGEVVVADNGSTDNSQQIASTHGARVISVEEKGYGSALMGGIQAAQGKYVIMGDADDSYDFSALESFIEKLHKGNQLVMGNRFKGGIMPNAMPPLHRYLGSPVLSSIGRLFFNSDIRDFHCGLRGFDREAILNLDLRASGMEFASEMIVKATLQQLSIVEVPTILHPDGRSHPPHLRSWHDGWRHLRFLLLYSPRWLFYYPGLVLITLGIIGMIALLPGPLIIANVTFDIHTLLLSGTAIILGVQTTGFAILAKQYARNLGFIPSSQRFDKLVEKTSLEKILILAAALFCLGVGGIIFSIAMWSNSAFGELDASKMMRLLVPATTLTAVGIQSGFIAFFKSILDIKTRTIE